MKIFTYSGNMLKNVQITLNQNLHYVIIDVLKSSVEGKTNEINTPYFYNDCHMRYCDSLSYYSRLAVL